MATRADPKEPVAVRVHPINVGQGDAILLEIQYAGESSKKCLIDGGRGQKFTLKNETPFFNLTTALDDNECISQVPESTSSGGKTWKDRSYRQIRLDSIVNTHPDADHHGGINALLGTGSKEIKSGEKFTVCCPVITTSAASLYVEVPKGKNGHRNGEDYSSAESDCPHFWFQKTALGRRHTGLEDLPQRSTVTIGKSPTFKEDFNATSILTTVKLPKRHNDYDYDVVLTGDSYGGIILDELELRPKEGKRKTVGVFQVPHHGSKKNSTMAGQGSYKSCHDFYMQFDADIYLISHGEGYGHPDSEVITGILSAAVEKKQDRKCKIVVTATRFEESKIKGGEINWRERVDILHFKKDIPYVTLDPNKWTVPEGLEPFSNPDPKNEEDDQCVKEGPPSSPALNKSEETPIKECSRSKSKCAKTLSLNPESVGFIQPSTCQDQGHANPATLAKEVVIKSLACTVCGKQTGPTCVVICKLSNAVPVLMPTKCVPIGLRNLRTISVNSVERVLFVTS